MEVKTAKYKAYYVDGTTEVFEYDEEPSFKHLYKIIGTDLVQQLPYTNYKMWCDEMGLMKGLELNQHIDKRWTEMSDGRYPDNFNACLGTAVELIDCVFD